MGIEENKALLKKTIEANVKRDIAMVEELNRSDFVGHLMSANPPVDFNLEQVKQMLENPSPTLSDYKITIEDMIAEGDKVSVRTTVSGKHTGKFFNIESTGKSVTIAQYTIFRIQDGKIAEGWNLGNAAGLLEQVGVIPPLDEIGK